MPPAGVQSLNTNTSGPLVGTVRWSRPDWSRAYYPTDMPPEWRLAFYANDCDCVLLDADAGLGTAGDALTAALDELAADLTFFVRADPGAGGLDATLARLRGRNVALLAGAEAGPSDDRVRVSAAIPGPIWRQQPDGSWLEPDNGRRVLCWTLQQWAPRELRPSIAALPSDTAALLLDGPAATPALCRDLRVLVQLLHAR